MANEVFADPRVTPLRSPRSDAEALAGLLRAPDVGDFEVDLVLDSSARDVQLGINRLFRQADAETLTLLYMTGHGAAGLAGLLYIAHDTDPDWAEATGVRGAFLGDCMKNSLARTQVIILDCCFSGAFANDLFAKGGSPSILDLGDLESAGWVVITSSNASQPSFEFSGASGGWTSAFTRACVDGIATGAADMDGDGLISLTELYSYAHSSVVQRIPSQVPSLTAREVGGDVIIAKAPVASKPTPVLPLELEQALEHPYPSIQLAAIQEVGKLQRSAVPERAAAARKLLLKIVRDVERPSALVHVAEAALRDHDNWKRRVRSSGRRSRGVSVSRLAGELWFEAEEDAIRTALERVLRARSLDEYRPILQGVFVEAHDDVVRFTATDSYRLAWSEINASIAADHPPSLISGDELAALPLRKRNTSVRFYAASEFAEVETASAAYRLDVVQGQFVAYKQLIPKWESTSTVALVDRGELALAVDELSQPVEDVVPVVLEIGSDAIRLTRTREHLPSAERTVAADVSGDPLRVAFNGVYLGDGLAGSADNRVRLGFAGSLRPALIAGSDPFGYLVMPVRLSDEGEEPF